MKHKMFNFVCGMVAATFMLFSGATFADVAYPFTNPTYIPTASSPAVTYTAPFDYAFQSNGVNVASVRITGTCTSLAATVQGSNDNGTTWTDMAVSSISGGSSTIPLTGAGFWRVNASGLNKLRVHATALTASCTVAMAGTSGTTIATDPCDDPALMKANAVVAQGASTTGVVVPAVTGKAIYVCGFAVTGAGTNPTMTFISGTQTTTPCDTAPANASGAMVLGAANGSLSYSLNGTVFSAAASRQVCITTAATTSVQGVLTYVQQ